MFELTSHSIVQFTTLIIYVILIPVILFYGQSRLKKLFLVLLFTSAGWSVTSLLVSLQLPYEQVVFWKALVLFFSAWSIVAYAHFAAAFVQRGVRTVAKLGYGWLSVVFVLVGFGYCTQAFALLDNAVIPKYYEQLFYFLTLGSSLNIGIISFILVRSLKAATNPEERNRIAYLMAGLGFIIAASVVWNIAPDTSYTLYHIGHTVNAILITYALVKYRLLNIQLVIKRWLVYTGVTVSVTLAYLTLLLSLSNLLRLLPPQLGIPATVAMVLLFAFSFQWLKAALDKGADRLLYGKRYIHRQILLSFANKMSNFIDTKEIADALLGPLTMAIRAKQVSLLFANGDYYSTKFITRLSKEEQAIPFRLHQNSFLIQWLEKEGRPLLRESVETAQEFNKLSQEDRDAISTAQIELLCPILSKHTLVGILALSNKHPQGHYSRDDVDLVAKLANEAAVAIENAQMYASAKAKADTDELTGLRNHRYFQERLNEEIERCSQSGDVFSLLFMDLDFFKTYNDIYGHTFGDEILRGIGRLIKDSIRHKDIGTRYGGDEFAIILPQTSLDDARMVAERVRRQLEVTMNWKGVAVTCSIGIACWLTDGVVREKIIQAADSALYHAKRAGGNQVCLAHGLQVSEPERPETTVKPDDKVAIASIVHALSATVDGRDPYTYGHSTKVSKYATDIARAIGYSQQGIERIRTAALLHDIGKLNLPDKPLMKCEPLTDEDWDMIRQHPNLGVGILKYIVGLPGCWDAVLSHHERYDGNGYPRGLSGKDIPLDARIISIADAYDAMMSKRHHRATKSTEEEAMMELERCAGTQFDPAIVKIFVELCKQSLARAVEAENKSHKLPS